MKETFSVDVKIFSRYTNVCLSLFPEITIRVKSTRQTFLPSSSPRTMTADEKGMCPTGSQTGPQIVDFQVETSQEHKTSETGCHTSLVEGHCYQ